MAEACLLGVDIGTTLTKAVLVTTGGKEIAAASVEYGVLHPRALWAEQWPDIWFDAVCDAVRDVLRRSAARADQVLGASIGGLYGGSGIPVDASMNPLRPCIIWMDRRATAEVAWIREHVDVDALFAITGNGVDTYHGFTKMLWIRDHEPEIWHRTRKLVTPHGYVTYRLTGELAIDQSSAGNVGGVFDLKQRRWSEKACGWLGISPQLLPDRIVESSDVVGHVTGAAAQRTGLAVGTPVIAGGIDAAVATLSAGAFEEGNHVAMIGTSMCWGVIHEGEALSPKLVSMPYVAYPFRKIYTFGGAATAGALPRWFRDQFGHAETTTARDSKADAYQLLDREAEEIPPGSDRLLVLPYFMGERSPIWDSDARGAILGLTLSHTRAHVYRALLEGVALALRHNIEAGLEAGLRLDDTLTLVGGAAKSPLWRQILSDATGYRLVAVRGSEAALGNALLAGVGTGSVESFEEIRKWLTLEEPTVPDPKAGEVYEAMFRLYKESYESLRRPMAGLTHAP